MAEPTSTPVAQPSATTLSATTPAASSGDDDAPLVFAGTAIYARDGAALPARCVRCGDSLELAAFRTVPGRVRYWVCREHRVEAIGKLVGGLAMIAIAVWQLAGPLLDRALPTRTTLLYFTPILLAGVALAAHAVPVHAGRSRGGRRRILGAGRVARTPSDL